jgi:hypothetical protein
MSGVWRLLRGKSKSRGKNNQAPTTPVDPLSELDVNSPHDAFDILRHNVRRVRSERLARRVPPHQRRLPPHANNHNKSH